MPKLGGGAFGTGNWEEDLKFFRSVHLEPVRWRQNVLNMICKRCSFCLLLLLLSACALAQHLAG